MNDQPPQPLSTPPQAPPPPPPAAPTGPAKASGGMRALAVAFALIMAFGAAVMIIVGLDVNDLASCDNPEEVIASGQLECFEGSEGIKPVVVGLAIASGVVGAVAFLLGIAFAITGLRGRLFAQVSVAAVLLAALALVIG